METNLKLKMTFDEMAYMFNLKNPAFVPNRSNVGRFAKKNGYILTKQVIDKKQVYFYLKDEQK